MSRSLFVKSRALTKHDQVRDQLSQLEALIGGLGHGLGEEMLTIPVLFDQITVGLAELHAAGQSTPAETGRLESASARLQRKAAVFLRDVGGVQVARNARDVHQPDPAHWWWFLDQVVIDKRRAWLRRWLVGGAIAAMLLVLLSFIYQRFLAPDPVAMTRYRHQRAAESLAQTGNWADALSEVEQALSVLPNDPDLLTLKGILQQKLGQREVAEKTFAAAEARFVSREEFLIVRAEQFLGLEQNEAALADAQEVVAIQADSAMGYLLLGQANANLGNYAEAIVAFQQAADLAESQGKPQLAATARIQMGMAMQMMPIPTATSP